MGKVIGTEPPAGARVRERSTIRLVLSTGPAQRRLDCSPSGGSGADVSIDRGTELRFVNTSSVSMKVVFDGEALPGSPSAIDSGGSFARTFAEAGIYGYKCYFEIDGEQTGKITVALGGDCLADLGVIRVQPDLFGQVASDPTVSRLVDVLAAEVDAALAGLRAVENTRARADSFAGTSTTGSPSATSRWARWRPTPWQPSTAHSRRGHARPAASRSR